VRGRQSETVVKNLSRVQRDLLIIAAGFDKLDLPKFKEELKQYYYSNVTRQKIQYNLEKLREDKYLNTSDSMDGELYAITEAGEDAIALRRRWENQIYQNEASP